jgi:hypothetical protein
MVQRKKELNNQNVGFVKKGSLKPITRGLLKP